MKEYVQLAWQLRLAFGRARRRTQTWLFWSVLAPAHADLRMVIGPRLEALGSANSECLRPE